MTRLRNYINEEKLGFKAGIIPYYIDDKGELNIMLVIPSDPEYGGTSYQIAKGRSEEDEKPEQTARREASEELGLKKSNMGKIFLGAKEVIQGMMRKYNLFVYALEVKDPDNFGMSDYEIQTKDWLNVNDLRNIRNSQKNLIMKVIKRIKGKI